MFKLILVLAAFISSPAFAKTTYIDVTPALASFATPYTANDVLGGINTVVSRALGTKSIEALGSLTVIDKAKQTADIDVCLFDSLPSAIAADNAAWDLTDANALKTLGCVSVATADYIDSASNSVATKRGLSLLIPTGSGQVIYAVAITRDGPTFVSATDLVIRFGFYEE